MRFQFSDFHIINKDTIKEIYIPVPKSAHKGSNGFGLLIAGSQSMKGAALLSAKAALRSGIGKLIVHAPTEVLNKLIVAVPETMTDADENPYFFSSLPQNIAQYDALAIGPGLANNRITEKGFLELLEKRLPYPIIVDADALNILADNKDWLHLIPRNSIITPHLGEFDRLFGKSANRFERVLKSQDFAQKYGINVILKGHYSTIATFEGKVFLNTTGNQGMATAGSGDVLTGILLGLLAKGYAPENAAKLGVYLHGLAGDIALKKQSYESMIASDIIENLGYALKEVSRYTSYLTPQTSNLIH